MLSRLVNALSRRRDDRDDDARPAVTLEDIAQYIHDPERAAQALGSLQRLQAVELVDVYLPAGWAASGERRFNVWNSHQIVPGGERVTLEAWCARWLAAAEWEAAQ
jgi:hypothetical protein